MKKLYYYWFDDLIIKAGYFLEENAPLNNQEIIGDGFQKPILVDGVVVESITQAEIDELNKPIVPESISAMRLKLQLFDLGITDEDVFQDIDSIPESMFSLVDKERAKIKYKTATTFDRNNGELNFIATMEGLTQEELDNIFINENK